MRYTIKPIKTEYEHEQALKYIEYVMDKPKTSKTEQEKLGVVVELVDKYEKERFPINDPDPVEMIKFMMEQQDLKQTDLVQYIGSKSAVSEVLAGKKNLTVDMIRNLEAGLGIPASSLVQKPPIQKIPSTDSEWHHWNNALVKEMAEKNYFDGATLQDTPKESLLEKFFANTPENLVPAFREANHKDKTTMSDYAKYAWCVWVYKQSKEIRTDKEFKKEMLTKEFIDELKHLSTHKQGPAQAQKMLKKVGIILVVASHLQKTYLDGGTFWQDKKKTTPVIGITIRQDRIDNFWFTLMHELAHIELGHISEAPLLDEEIERTKENEREQDADEKAQNYLIPFYVWENSPAKILPSPLAAESLAQDLKIHPAIVAGRIRHEHNNYRILGGLVKESVRHLFPRIK